MKRLLLVGMLVIISVPTWSMGRGTERGGASDLRDALPPAAEEAWGEEFTAALLDGDAEGRIPAPVLALAVASLPEEATELTPGDAARLVREEAVELDRSLRRGERTNRAAIESARRLWDAVGRAREAAADRSVGPQGKPDGPPGQAEERRGPPAGVGPNRAGEALQRRNAPGERPGGPPESVPSRGKPDDTPAGGGPPDNRGPSGEDPGGDSPDGGGPPDEDTAGGVPDDTGPPVDAPPTHNE